MEDPNPEFPKPEVVAPPNPLFECVELLAPKAEAPNADDFDVVPNPEDPNPELPNADEPNPEDPKAEPPPPPVFPNPLVPNPELFIFLFIPSSSVWLINGLGTILEMAAFC